MKYHIITTFHPAGLQRYGQTMIDSFERHWPQSVDLTVYAEDCVPKTTQPRVCVLDLHATSPDLVAFKTRYRNDPVANGTVMKDTNVPYKDNNFKWDAVRFSHKVFSVIHGTQHIDADWVIWLDADTKTFRDVPENFLDEICNTKAMACYLGRREKYHSECGWVAYNRRHPDLVDFMREWRELHFNGGLFNLREYHDSFVFDHLRRKFQQERETFFYDLSPATTGKGPGHPFIASRLGEYMDHMKGDRRKDLGKSEWKGDAESASFHPDVEYWQSTIAANGHA